MWGNFVIESWSLWIFETFEKLFFQHVVLDDYDQLETWVMEIDWNKSNLEDIFSPCQIK